MNAVIEVIFMKKVEILKLSHFAVYYNGTLRVILNSEFPNDFRCIPQTIQESKYEILKMLINSRL